MNQLSKTIFALVLMAAVMGYTVYNYVTGKTEFTMFLVCMAIVGIPFVKMINLLLQQLRKK